MKALICALAVFVLGGCSSVKVHSSDEMVARPYAGTKIAYENTKRAWRDYKYVGQFEHSALDTLGSVFLDTITLPYDWFQRDEKKP